MLLTEDEAKQKWCPHIMYCQNPSQVSAFEALPLMVNSACVASLCMAWRWDNDKPCEEAPSYEHPKGQMTWVKVGYCGLSGRPRG